MHINVAELYSYDLASALANEHLATNKTRQIHVKFIVKLQACSIGDGEGDGNLVVCSCLIAAKRKIERCDDGSHFLLSDPSFAAMTSPAMHPAATISANRDVGAECGKTQWTTHAAPRPLRKPRIAPT